MSPFKEVPSLQNASLNTLETAIVDTCKELVSHSSETPLWTQQLETLKILLEIPITPYHRNRFSKICRLALKVLDSDSSVEMPSKDKKHIFEHLLSTLIGCKPTTINLDEFEETWSKLVDYFDKVNDLRTFYCSTGFLLHENKPVFLEKILAASQFWSKLRVFIFGHGCTDDILSSISQHCLQLRELDVNSSKNVTDSCIPQLIKCQNLEAINLRYTSISATGLSDFLVKSRSRDLIKLECGFQKDHVAFDEVISSWRCDSPVQQPSSLIKFLACDELSVKGQKVLTTFFPNLSQLEIIFKSEVPSLTCLQDLQNLEKLSLILIEKPAVSILNAIPPIGSVITSLALMCKYQSDLSRTLEVISSSCPNLESLSLIQHQIFLNDNLPCFQPQRQPFQKLRSLCWSDHIQSSYLTHILKYAQNIEEIDLFELKSSNNISIADEFIEDIMNINPLSQLQRLSCTSSRLTLSLFKNLIQSCKKLLSLNVSITQADLKDLKNFIKEGNYDLKELLAFDPSYY